MERSESAGPRFMGSPRRFMAGRFQPAMNLGHADRPPRRCSPGFILHALVVSSEFLHSAPARDLSIPGTTYQGFRFLFATSPFASTQREVLPSSLRSALRFFHLSTVSSAPG